MYLLLSFTHFFVICRWLVRKPGTRLPLLSSRPVSLSFDCIILIGDRGRQTGVSNLPRVIEWKWDICCVKVSIRYHYTSLSVARWYIVVAVPLCRWFHTGATRRIARSFVSSGVRRTCTWRRHLSILSSPATSWSFRTSSISSVSSGTTWYSMKHKLLRVHLGMPAVRGYFPFWPIGQYQNNHVIVALNLLCCASRKTVLSVFVIIVVLIIVLEWVNSIV